MTPREIYSLEVGELEERVLGHWPGLSEACAFAQERHEGQERKEGGPYVAHPFRVALLLKERGGLDDEGLACAALLHDLVEDTSTSHEEIRLGFGSRVSDLVRSVTQPDRAEGETKFERNMRSFEALRWEGRDAQILRSADRLDNLTTAKGAFSAEREAEYVCESRDGLLPITLAVNTPLYHALAAAIEELDSAVASGPGGDGS